MKFEYPLVLIAILFVLAHIYLILRRRRAVKRLLPALVRALVLILLLITLAGPKLKSQLQTNYVYFVVDISQSTGVAQEELIELLLKRARPSEHTRYGIIVFGKEAAIEEDFSAALPLKKEFLSVVRTDGTDIAAALRLALDTFPKEGNKEIFLLSDGYYTQGELEGVLARAKKENVLIHTLPISEKQAEVWLEQLKLPSQVAVGMTFPIKIKMGANQSGLGSLSIERDGRVLLKRAITLTVGPNEFELQEKLEKPGAFLYRARIDMQADTLPQNNELEAVVTSLEGPQVLLLESWQGDAQRSHVVERLLQSSNYAYDKKLIEEFELSASSLAPYKAVVLNNVSLASFGEQELMALKSYVEGLGGGLFAILGKEAVEGVLRTEFEKILPVSFSGPKLADIPPLAVAILLDKSSSMGEYAGGDQKIELLKRAATAAIKRLGEADMVGVIAFSDEATWLVEMQSSLSEANKGVINQKIEGLQAGGGTILYPALKAAFEALKNREARMKHIIVFSDGKAEKHSHALTSLLEEIKDSTVAISAVAIDEQPDIDFLQRLVEAGKGQLYPAKDMKKLPLISLRVARDVTRSRWVEGDIKLEPTEDSWLKEFVEAVALPHLEGYVLTYKKEGSQTALQSRRGDPVLSFWRYGLGKVAVLNTDLDGKWSKRLIRSDALSRLFSQTLSKVYSEHVFARENMAIHTELSGSRLHVRVDLQEAGQWVLAARLEGQLLGTTTRLLDFTQVLPGRYQAQVDELEEGVYLLKISAQKDGVELASGTKNISVPYPEEYKRLGLNVSVLRQIAASTGGVYIESDEVSPERLFTGWQYKDAWSTSLLIALGLFLADLILRKWPPVKRARKLMLDS